MFFSAMLMVAKMMITIKRTVVAKKMSTLTNKMFSINKMRLECKSMEVVKQCLHEGPFIPATLRARLLRKRKMKR